MVETMTHHRWVVLPEIQATHFLDRTNQDCTVDGRFNCISHCLFQPPAMEVSTSS